MIAGAITAATLAGGAVTASAHQSVTPYRGGTQWNFSNYPATTVYLDVTETIDGVSRTNRVSFWGPSGLSFFNAYPGNKAINEARCHSVAYKTKQTYAGAPTTTLLQNSNYCGPWAVFSDGTYDNFDGFYPFP